MLSVLVLLQLLLVPAFALSPLAVGWNTYKTLLTEKPILTKAATSALIMGISDAVTQRLERKFHPSAEKGCKHSWKRTQQALLTGFLWSGPSAHAWYQILEDLVIFLQIPPVPLVLLASRVTLDALIFSPITIFGFFVVSTLLQGGTFGDIRDKLTRRWKQTVLGAWRFWPIVNVLSFSMIPLQFRVLYCNVMALFWSGYLSYMSNMKKAESSIATTSKPKTA